MPFYPSLRWRRRNTSTSSLIGRHDDSHTKDEDDEDANLGWVPGQIVVFDYNPSPTVSASSPSPLPFSDQPIKCLQWNIERGYRLDAVVATLKSHDADIICLQELDVHCARSQYRNAAREIAEALQMTLIFVVEFEEIYSRRRNSKTQGGGWHGNAVLCRFPVLSYHRVRHTHHPVNWELDGERMGEPRRGERVTLCVVMDVYGHKVAAYTVHLEVFCGILGRIRQFKDILDDSRRLLTEEGVQNQIIFGDLNTMGHGVARFHPRFCRDSLRWKTMGSSEAAFWHRHLFAYTTDMGDRNELLVKFKLEDGELASLRNPHFYDPVPQLHTTLRSARGFFQGRLDWTLVRAMRAVDYGLDNHDYRKSDHKLMWVLLELMDESGEGDPGPDVYNDQLEEARSSSLLRFWLVIVLVAFLAYTIGALKSFY